MKPFHTSLATVLLLLQTACGSGRESSYVRGPYYSEDAKLYFIRVDTTKVFSGISIPEHREPKAISERYYPVTIDLHGKEAVAQVNEYQLVPKSMPVASADYEYLMRAQNGSLEIWGRSALEQMLRTSAPEIHCAGTIEFDRQDPRILYYFCRKEALAYRFDKPFSRACMLRLTLLSNVAASSIDNAWFLSKWGESGTYVWADRSLFKIDGCSGTSAIHLAEWRLESATVSNDRESSTTETLVGITSDTRVTLTKRSNKTYLLFWRAGMETAMEIALPTDLAADVNARPMYLAKDETVIWERADVVRQRWVIDSVELLSGTFHRAVLPFL